MKKFYTIAFFIWIILGCTGEGNIGFAQSLLTGKTFNVKNYGAVGNSEVKDTEAINKVIRSCAEAGMQENLVKISQFQDVIFHFTFIIQTIT